MLACTCGMYFWTGPDGIVVVELRFGEVVSEERLRANLPADIVDQRRYRIQVSPWRQCPTCQCPCNRYRFPSERAGKSATKV